MRILGIAGSLNSGKDTVAQVLEEHGFFHMSTSDMLRAKKKQAFGDSPEALLKRNDPFAIQLRADKGAGVLVELIDEQYKKVADTYPAGFVASGLRSIGEAEKIKQLGGSLVFVDADIGVRYERSLTRARDAVEHGITLEDFVNMEKSESPDDDFDKTLQNLPALKKMADVHIRNNGNDLKVFKIEVERTLDLI
jgi:dephospho-CoA kinase